LKLWLNDYSGLPSLRDSKNANEKNSMPVMPSYKQAKKRNMMKFFSQTLVEEEDNNPCGEGGTP